jgi:hypothetical protein
MAEVSDGKGGVHVTPAWFKVWKARREVQSSHLKFTTYAFTI